VIATEQQATSTSPKAMRPSRSSPEPGGVSRPSEASFDRQFAVNARGAFFTVQRLAPLVKDGGSITLTTVTPATASPSMSVYMGSKAAVQAFAQVFAAVKTSLNDVEPSTSSQPLILLLVLDELGRVVRGGVTGESLGERGVVGEDVVAGQRRRLVGYRMGAGSHAARLWPGLRPS
jgi:NAD(P)-dependent dehydrogenase (short-subunit alcohol dehydrogenase family)